MSSLNTNFINNTTRTTANNSEKNLQLGSDGSVTSFEGLSISDAAASNGLNYIEQWSGSNYDKFYSFDRSKFNKFTVSGWVDLPGESANNTGIGLFIQPCISSVPYTLSQLNGGFPTSWQQPNQAGGVVSFSADQMVYNTAATPAAVAYRWIFELEIIFNDKIIWSIVSPSTFIDYNVIPNTTLSVVRQLTAQNWDTTLGNQIDTFRILTNSLTSTSLCRGELGVKISRDTSFSNYT
ncbi:hypothetical protein CC030809_00267 [Synechococcus phage S-CAM7]|uniref:Uncharacterized protein n=1 Tax=Synechococcus phage S-CAM7 TaxID=1883368 RepID=A0A7D5FUQ2_9CAUD|nr:hypothetical protein CC030809_00267 [Synechococcus phage S-CAM7]